jgi:hypothetical protein
MYEATVCNCKAERALEEEYWTAMIDNIRECKKIASKEMQVLLHGKRMKSPKKNYRRAGDSKEK